MTTDRAALEEAIANLHGNTSYQGTIAGPTFASVPKIKFDVIVAAARAHLAALPRTKPMEVRLVARMSDDGKSVYCCYSDTPDNRAAIERMIRADFGGQIVELRGTAQVPE